MWADEVLPHKTTWMNLAGSAAGDPLEMGCGYCGKVRRIVSTVWGMHVCVQPRGHHLDQDADPSGIIEGSLCPLPVGASPPHGNHCLTLVLYKLVCSCKCNPNAVNSFMSRFLGSTLVHPCCFIWQKSLLFPCWLVFPCVMYHHLVLFFLLLDTGVVWVWSQYE